MTHVTMFIITHRGAWGTETQSDTNISHGPIIAAHNKGHGFASHLCNCCIQGLDNNANPLSTRTAWSSGDCNARIKVQINNVIIPTMIRIQQNRGRKLDILSNECTRVSSPVSQSSLIITWRCGAARWRRRRVAASSRPRPSCWSWLRAGWGSSRRPGYRPAPPETENNQPRLRHGGCSTLGDRIMIISPQCKYHILERPGRGAQLSASSFSFCVIYQVLLCYS